MVMEKRLSNERIDDIVSIIGIAGVAAGVDFVSDGTVNHPYGSLALGAGMVAGFEATGKNRKWSTIYTTLGALAVSLYPQFAELDGGGDIKSVVQGILTKTLAYGAGITVAVAVELVEGSRYDSVFDLEATFDSENQARRAYKTLSHIVQSGRGLSQRKSSINEPQGVDSGYRVTGRITGNGDNLSKSVQPSVRQYLESMSPLEVVVSAVLRTSHQR